MSTSTQWKITGDSRSWSYIYKKEKGNVNLVRKEDEGPQRRLVGFNEMHELAQIVKPTRLPKNSDIWVIALL